MNNKLPASETETKISLAFLEDMPEGFLQKFETANGKFHFITFKDNDYTKQVMTVTSYDHTPEILTATLPIDMELQAAAFDDIKKLNPHVKLAEVKRGMMEGDFKRKTITIIFIDILNIKASV